MCPDERTFSVTSCFLSDACKCENMNFCTIKSESVVFINTDVFYVVVLWVVMPCNVMVSYHNITWHHNPGDLDVKHHRRENLENLTDVFQS